MFVFPRQGGPKVSEQRTGRPWMRLVLVVALGGAAYVANWFPVPLSFGLHMLFGGVFAILAAILYGPWAGGFVALLSSLPTIQLWGHPYAVISMTLEAWVVGYEARRGRAHHTETDLIYWLLVGGPLVTITYSLGAHIPLMATGVAALKQAVNGLVNTAAASMVVLGLVVWQRGRRQMALQVFLTNLISFLVLTPLAFSLSLTARESGQHLRNQLAGEAVRAGEVVRAGLAQELADLHQALAAVAQWGATGPTPAGLSQVWLANPPAMPPGPVSGVTTLLGAPGATVLLREGAGGAVAAVDLDRLSRRVLGLVQAMEMEIVVTDSASVVALSSWEGVQPGTTFISEVGEATLFRPPGLSWLPSLTDGGAPENASLRQAENVASVQRVALPELGWQIYIRKPLGEVEYLLYRSYLGSFVTALGLMIILLAAIRVAAYTVTRPLVQLAGISVSADGEIANLPPTLQIWVTEVRAVAAHLMEVAVRIRGLIQSLHETQRELQRHNVELSVANVHLADEALRDAHTGLLNKRAFWQQIQIWVEENQPFSVALAELQGPGAHRFAAAEEQVKGLAAELQHFAALHGGEVYQYAADRFALLFPESSERLASRLTLALPSVAVIGEAELSLAAGVARFPEEGRTGPEVIREAEQRLTHSVSS